MKRTTRNCQDSELFPIDDHSPSVTAINPREPLRKRARAPATKLVASNKASGSRSKNNATRSRQGTQSETRLHVTLQITRKIWLTRGRIVLCMVWKCSHMQLAYTVWLPFSLSVSLRWIYPPLFSISHCWHCRLQVMDLVLWQTRRHSIRRHWFHQKISSFLCAPFRLPTLSVVRLGRYSRIKSGCSLGSAWIWGLLIDTALRLFAVSK